MLIPVICREPIWPHDGPGFGFHTQHVNADNSSIADQSWSWGLGRVVDGCTRVVAVLGEWWMVVLGLWLCWESGGWLY